MTLVAGADVAKGKWVVVVLEDGRFSRALIGKTISEILSAVANLAVLAIDIPIGLPEGKDYRACDTAARTFVGARGSSVFFTPPRSVLEAPTYQEGNQLSWRGYERGVSAQAYALGQKILEVDPIAASDERIIEVHPEVCFRAMKDGPLIYSKKSWNGQMERRSLLESKDIQLQDVLEGAGEVPPDDLLDAAAAAWSAWRMATGNANVLPDSATGCATSRRGIIWF